ncbi:MAG: hypothetical protein V5A62_08675 [Haloarculaceae archaeon]
MNAGRRRFLATLGAAGASALTGCSSPSGSSGDRSGRTNERDGTATLTAAPASPTPSGGTSGPTTAYRYTSLTPGGNRIVAGGLGIGAADPVDLPLESDPRWVLARPEPDGPGADWVVVSESGTVSAFGVRRDGIRGLDVTPSTVEVGRPPVLRSTGRATLLTAPGEASTLTHPLPLDESGLLYVRPDGTVARERDGGRTSVDVAVLPDARPRLVDEGRVAVLGGATDRYGHGALGDEVEAGRLVVLDVGDPELRVVGDVRLEGPVIEGLAPLVAGDDPALHVTESDRTSGARQVAYATDGSRLAAGPPVGRGLRWRHQLCIAPFAPDGVPELAVVRTPHIGGTAEFYRREDEGLAIAATESGVSSHALGSRVLDGGLAADVDGDGRPELVVPDDDRTSLVVVKRTAEGASTTDRVPVGGRVTSNVHAVRAPTGLQVGVGRPGGLRVWA